MPLQLEMDSNGARNLTFSFFTDYSCKHFNRLQDYNKLFTDINRKFRGLLAMQLVGLTDNVIKSSVSCTQP